MQLIDVRFLDTPFFGVRQMSWHLRNEGNVANEKHVHRLKRLTGLMPTHQTPNTSRPVKRHNPYLPIHLGFLYLLGIMDWHTRMVLSWWILNMLDADCLASRR